MGVAHSQPGGEPALRADARERLLNTAYELFSRHGVQAVGVDSIVERSGVARQTMYRHFRSKQELVLAFLARREELWTYGWLTAEVQRRASDPADQLLAVFDVFDEWFHRADFEGCSFINVMNEHPNKHHPIHRAAAQHLANIRELLADLARRAGLAAPTDAATRAREIAGMLLQRAR
jgi:AcrR family transcriptional regulator